MGHLPAGGDREIADLFGGEFPAVALHDPDQHVGAPGGPAPALGQHGHRLADPGCRTEVHPQPAARPRSPAAGLASAGRRVHAATSVTAGVSRPAGRGPG